MELICCRTAQYVKPEKISEACSVISLTSSKHLHRFSTCFANTVASWSMSLTMLTKKLEPGSNWAPWVLLLLDSLFVLASLWFPASTHTTASTCRLSTGNRDVILTRSKVGENSGVDKKMQRIERRASLLQSRATVATRECLATEVGIGCLPQVLGGLTSPCNPQPLFLPFRVFSLDFRRLRELPEALIVDFKYRA